MSAAWVVFCKELIDALRDRRTLMMALLSSVAIGPVVLLLFGSLIGDLEKRAEQRVVMVSGAEYAPTLINYLQRQNVTVEPAPEDYEAKLRRSKLGDAVIVLPKDFEAKLSEGEPPTVEVIGMGANARASTSLRRAVGLLQGFGQERSSQRLIMLGVAPGSLSAIDVQERDLANRQARAAQLTGLVPFFVMMAVLYGAMTAALDTTAGERERGSLEPLLMNPSARWSLVAGKWAAVAAVGMLIAFLSCLSFLPAQSLMRSETLAAMFQFGAPEMLRFLALLLPFAAAASALMMAVAIRTKSFKEAQANNTVVMLVITLLPSFAMFSQDGESPWHLWMPGLGQITLMNRVLKGELVGGLDMLIPFLACTIIVVLALTYVSKALKRASVR